MKKNNLKNKLMMCAVLSSFAVPVISAVQPTSVHAATFPNLNAKQNKFLNDVAEFAKVVANENDLYASVMIAQAILETGWGSSKLSSAPYHNLFGIKGSYQGNSVVMNTREETPNGVSYYINDGFRAYPSYKESLYDYVNLIKGKDLYKGAWKSNTNSYQDATKHLTGRYATATNYNVALNRIIQQYNLTQYDTPKQPVVNKHVVQPEKPVVVQPTPVTPAPPVQTKTEVKNKTYTVKRGDSVWGISNRHGISMNDFKAWNNIGSNNLIHPGQVVIVGKETVTTTVNPSTPTPPKTETPKYKTYTVKRGDSVWRISQLHGMTMQELKSLNGIGANNLIHPGQVLKVK